MDAMTIIKDIIYIIITALALPLTKCLVDLTKYSADLFRAKISQISVNVKEETLNRYIKFAENAICKAVVSVNQTYVESLKASGNFNEDAQKEAKEKAMTIAKQLITKNIKEAITMVYGDFDSYLDATVETIVNENK